MFKIAKKSFLLSWLFVTSICAASTEFDLWIPAKPEKPAFQQFIEDHRPSENMQKLIQEQRVVAGSDHVRAIKADNGRPAWYMKDDVSRVIYAEKLKTFIDRNKLDRLDVADKYVYPVEGSNGSLRWRVFAQAVALGESLYVKKITLQEIQQLAQVSEGLNYSDWHAGNIVRSKQGTLVFIDTEKMSFHPLGIVDTFIGDDLSTFARNDFLEDDALAWLEQRKKSHADAKLSTMVTVLRGVYRSMPTATDKEIIETWNELNFVNGD